VLAALALLFVSPTGRKPADPGPYTVARAWPKIQQGQVPGSLADGPAYQPVFFVDPSTSIGTAPNPPGTHLRLVVRAADGAVRQLRRLAVDLNPQFGGVTVDGDTVAWAETTTDAKGRGRTRLYTAPLSTAGPARLLTADTGDIAFFNSEYDMLIADGRLHWVAVGTGDKPVTEIRSVPLAGGKVSVRTEQGAWVLSAPPWLVSAASGQTGPVQLRNLATRRTTEVATSGLELASCSPVWCRVLIFAGDGPARVELMRPDGKDRQTVAVGTATAALVDVAVLDRFEVLSVAPPDANSDSQQLLVYDIATRRTVEVAANVGQVLYRRGVLWWSTGRDDATVWHALELRTA
jgi:hypothetical protein